MAKQYQLVEWTCRAIKEDKRSYISAAIPSMVEILHLTEEQWFALTTEIQQQSIAMLHGLEQLADSFVKFCCVLIDLANIGDGCLGQLGVISGICKSVLRWKVVFFQSAGSRYCLPHK